MPCIDTVQGFYFFRRRMSRLQAFTVAFLMLMQVIPPTPQNSTQGFAKAFPVICPTSAHAIQQEHKPPIRRLRSAGGHTVKRCASTNTRIPPLRRTLYRAGQPPIIIRYIRVQRCISVIDPCPAGQSSGKGAAGGRNHWRLAAASLFGLSPDS